MVVLKHILLATLATLAVASPPSTQWGKPDGTGAGVAPSGRPGDSAAGGGGSGGGKHGHGSDDDKHVDPSGGKNDHHQPRSWPQKRDDASDGAPGGAGHHGGWQPSGKEDHSGDGKHSMPSGGDSGSGKGNHKEPRAMPTGASDGAPAGDGHKPSGAPSGGSGSHGHGGEHGEGKHGDEKPPGMDGKGGGNNQHHARDNADSPKHHGPGKGKWDDPKKGDNPGKGGKGDHDRRDALEARDPSPGIDLHDDDPRLAELRHHANGGDSNWNATDSEHHPSKRGNPVGVTECMHTNFVSPCIWTEIKSETQCYNAKYDSYGSMSPDPGLCCSIFQQRNCDGDHWIVIPHQFHAPGIKDYFLSKLLLGWALNDEGINSMTCNFGKCKNEK